MQRDVRSVEGVGGQYRVSWIGMCELEGVGGQYCELDRHVRARVGFTHQGEFRQLVFSVLFW